MIYIKKKRGHLNDTKLIDGFPDGPTLYTWFQLLINIPVVCAHLQLHGHIECPNRIN